mgnify:CR=1 FL=1
MLYHEMCQEQRYYSPYLKEMASLFHEESPISYGVCVGITTNEKKTEISQINSALLKLLFLFCSANFRIKFLYFLVIYLYI